MPNHWDLNHEWGATFLDYLYGSTRVDKAIYKAGRLFTTMPKVTLVCPQCKKGFEVERWETKSGRKFCSKGCYWQNSRDKPRTFRRDPKKKTEVNCVGCGKKTLRYKSQLGKAWACSKKCKWSVGRTEITCEWCNETKVVPKCRAVERGRPRRFCSIACRNMSWGAHLPDGGWQHDSHGYLQRGREKSHPMASKTGKTLKHWWVMYEEGLHPKEWLVWAKQNGWSIHHRNGIRDDNRIENLQMRAPGKHPGGWSLEDMAQCVRDAGYEVIAPA